MAVYVNFPLRETGLYEMQTPGLNDFFGAGLPGMSMLFLDGCASLHFFSRCAQASSCCLFPEELV